jgi:N-acetyl-gamma-glutamyl-phosphate reductase
MEQALTGVAGRPVEILFTPHLIPMDRGILATIYATPTQAVTESELLAECRRYYEGRPFIRVRDSLPATKDTVGTNFLDFTVRVVRGKVLVIAAEDNLVRGASGVAVQNFNLMFGYDERTGLW